MPTNPRCLVPLAIVCLALVPTAPAESAWVREHYRGPSILAYQGPQDCADRLQSMGVVCLDLPEGAEEVVLRIRDASGLAIGAAYYFHDADGATVGLGSFCDDARLTLPPGAALAVIRLEAVNGPIFCADEGEPATGPATRGVVAMRLL